MMSGAARIADGIDMFKVAIQAAGLDARQQRIPGLDGVQRVEGSSLPVSARNTLIKSMVCSIIDCGPFFLYFFA